MQSATPSDGADNAISQPSLCHQFCEHVRDNYIAQFMGNCCEPVRSTIYHILGTHIPLHLWKLNSCRIKITNVVSVIFLNNVLRYSKLLYLFYMHFIIVLRCHKVLETKYVCLHFRIHKWCRTNVMFQS